MGPPVYRVSCSVSVRCGMGRHRWVRLACCAGHQQPHPHCEGDRILIELHPATAVLQLRCRSRVNMINFILWLKAPGSRYKTVTMTRTFGKHHSSVSLLRAARPPAVAAVMSRVLQFWLSCILTFQRRHIIAFLLLVKGLTNNLTLRIHQKTLL